MATSSTATHTDRLVEILRQGNAFKPETRDSLKTFLQGLFEERYHQHDWKRFQPVGPSVVGRYIDPAPSQRRWRASLGHPRISESSRKRRAARQFFPAPT